MYIHTYIYIPTSTCVCKYIHRPVRARAAGIFCAARGRARPFRALSRPWYIISTRVVYTLTRRANWLGRAGGDDDRSCTYLADYTRPRASSPVLLMHHCCCCCVYIRIYLPIYACVGVMGALCVRGAIGIHVLDIGISPARNSLLAPNVGRSLNSCRCN